MLFPTALFLSSLISLTISSPLSPLPLPPLDPRAATFPMPTYPNGTTNPFYPCGSNADETRECPYRCFKPTGEILPECYLENSSTAAILSQQAICVKCELPDQPEDYPGGCSPLREYFDLHRPSRCGFENHRLRNCAWGCNAAQVPFDLCDAQDTTGTYRLCEKCRPQCSSPRIVFKPPYLPSNFSVAAGSCSSQYGPQQVVACPWRCTDAGNPNTYCSLDDKTENRGFTSCVKCS